MSDNQVTECLKYCYRLRDDEPDLTNLTEKSGLKKDQIDIWKWRLIDRDDEAIPIHNGYYSANQRSDELITTKVQRATLSTLDFLIKNWDAFSSKEYFEDYFMHFSIFIQNVEAVDCQTRLQQFYQSKKLPDKIAFNVLDAMRGLCEISHTGDIKFWESVYDSGGDKRFSASISLLYLNEPSIAQRFPDLIECCMDLPYDHSRVFSLVRFLKRYQEAYPELYPQRLELVRDKIQNQPYLVDFEKDIRGLEVQK